MSCQAILLSRLFFPFASRPSAISCAPNHRIMTKSSPPPVERAFTLMEVLVVMAIILGLAAILIPSLRSALESAKATKDMSNLRQIGILMQTYLNDKDGILPVINAAPGIGTTAIPVIYPKYIGSKRVFQSPYYKRDDDET